MRDIAHWLRRFVLLSAIALIGACQAAPPPVSGAAARSGATKLQVPNPVVVVAVVGRSSGPDAAVTFAQPFVAGDVPAGETLRAITADGQKLPTQIDWKAIHEDGSRRHGIITIALPDSTAKSTTIGLYRVSGQRPGAGHSNARPPPQDIDARLVVDIDGRAYTASLQEMQASGVDRTWLSGSLVTEWHVSGPVTTDSNQPHDRIWVQFYVRQYAASGKTRVVAVVENTWALKPNPRDVRYDVQMLINNKEVYAQEGLSHTDHARWREVFWSGSRPEIYVQHDLGYLKATGTIPNYDPSLQVPESAQASLVRGYRASDRGPLGITLVTNPMANAGGRRDIGPLPAWTVLRLLTMDPRLIEVDRGVGASAGSWPVHLRDAETKRPVSLARHPRLSTHSNLRNIEENPLPKASNGAHSTKLKPDWSHQPSLAFVPYLLSGDYYYLEELQFWAAWNPLKTTPEYRGLDQGLFAWTQVRGQAWSLRTLGQVAYITPDDNPMKSYWQRQLQNNLDWYNDHYIGNPKVNALGFLEGEIIYTDDNKVRRGIAPWQDDFFTWAMGYLVNLGFEDARPMLEYKARFPVGRMTAPGYCWVLGSIYKLYVRDTEDGPIYDSFARAYKESLTAKTAAAECGSTQMARRFGKKYRAGDMVGHPSSPQGFPSNMQPALAAAVDAKVPDAERAWEIFMNRSTKPDYSAYPNWAIVPRK